MWTIFKKYLLNLLRYCFCYLFNFFASVLCFGHEACGILAPQSGIKPTPPTLEGEVLTTGPPGKSPNICAYFLKSLQTKKLRLRAFHELAVNKMAGLGTKSRPLVNAQVPDCPVMFRSGSGKHPLSLRSELLQTP